MPPKKKESKRAISPLYDVNNPRHGVLGWLFQFGPNMKHHPTIEQCRELWTAHGDIFMENDPNALSSWAYGKWGAPKKKK